MKNKNIVVIFVLLLLASIFIMPVSSQSSLPIELNSLPIELKLIAEPSTITLGETSTVTVKLLDEKGKPIMTEADIHVNISKTNGYVNSSMVILAGTNLSKIEFTSEDFLGVAVISAGSRGLISDTVSIAVVSAAMSSLSLEGTEAGTIHVIAAPAPTGEQNEESTPSSATPGFKAIFAITGLLEITYLLRKKK